MRRTALLLALLLVTAGSMTPARGESPVVYKDPGAGAFISDNASYMGTIPIEAIGGRMVEVGYQKRFYVTGAPGLVIYDVTNPAVPVPLGGLPLPHFQNEDADVSDDGSRVIISTDTANAGPNANGTVSAGGGSIRVIDTSNPAQPQVTGFIAESNHTSTCADPACDWIYGSSGKIYAVDEDGAITATGGRWRASGGGHALNRDESGLMISDSTPRLVLDVTGDFIPGSTPAEPGVVSQGRPNTAQFGQDGLLQHNNVRLGAAEWEPRDPESPDYHDTAMRPGELLIGNSESNVRTSCGTNAGGLSSWNMANFDEEEAEIEQIEVFRPVNGNWSDGNPAVNALGCSGHWFTVRDNMIAAAWYEHGLRFIAVDPATGEFTQTAFFQPVATEMGSAHWVTAPNGDEYVYTTDYARGIDIVKFDRSAQTPTQAEFDASWLANLGKVGALAEGERYLCRLGAAR